jgi:DHA1 family bicyclomycin/chloramphenicol resistance-like MFS transporter
MDAILVRGAVVAMLAGLVLGVASYFDAGGLWGLFIPLLVFVSMTGFIVANSIAGALSDFPEQAGSVSALVGAIQYGSGIAGSGLVGLFAVGTPWPMGWVIALMSIGSVLCVGLVVQGNSEKGRG